MSFLSGFSGSVDIADLSSARVRLYERFSSDEQGLGYSIEAQDRENRAFIATKRGWQITHVYKDEGISGQNSRRPQFQQMLHDAATGEFDVLVVHKLDRFARADLLDTLLLIRDLSDSGVRLASATEPIDLTTGIGQLFLVILVWLANWYVQNLSKEVTKGKRSRFEAGLWNGDLRYAYSREKMGEATTRYGKVKALYKPVPNDDAQHVRMAYELTKMLSDEMVASRMNATGSRTYRMIGNSRKKAGPETPADQRRPWTKDSVTSIFSYEAGQYYMGNTVYLGNEERKKVTESSRKGERYLPQYQVREGTHEAIIDKALYNDALAARAKRRNNQTGYTKHVHVYLLGAGLARCSVCGEPMRSFSLGKDKKLAYYQCCAGRRGGSCVAARKLLREDYLVAQLNRMVEMLTLPPDWREHITELMREPDEIAQLDDRRKALIAERERLNFQFRKGFIEESEYEQALTAIQTDLSRLVVPEPKSVLTAGEQLITFASTWSRSGKEVRTEMLHVMLLDVFVSVEEHEIVDVVPHRDFLPLFRQTRMPEREGRFLTIEANNGL